MQPPADPPPSARRWVPFAEAMRLLGTSETTLRRLIRQGKVVAETEPRAPGDSRVVYRVLIPEPPGDPPPSVTLSESEHPPAIRQEPPQDFSAALSVALGPLVAALDSERTERQKLAAEARLLAERAARAEAAAEHERAARERAEAELARERERSWWDRLLGRYPAS